MEHKSLCRFSVKPVTDDGIAESEGVGTMDAELVCATCHWMQFQKCMTVFVPEYAVVCPSRFAVFGINHLSGAIVKVWSQGKADVAFLTNWHLMLE